uniref:Uncharacterized protein n=1 Tax=Lates calcarifer TaxID=8187 RepID=A0A4W6EBE4_LATCA
MEDRTESPRAVKVEEHSQCVILTYFQGDINSMVDAHFTRALGKNCKAKAPAAKAKKLRKTIKSEDTSTCQGSALDSYTESQAPPLAGRLLAFGPADDAPGSWHSARHQGRRGPGFAIYRISPPVPRRAEPHWTAIRHVPTQPAAQ